MIKIFFKTVISCIFFNVTTADQYLSIIVNGKILRKTIVKINYLA